MIGTIRKHQTWLWVVIIIVVIVTFVFWGSWTQSGNQNQERNFEAGSIDGKPVTAEELANAQAETKLRYFISSGGMWP